jgi:hypothetical protein
MSLSWFMGTKIVEGGMWSQRERLGKFANGVCGVDFEFWIVGHCEDLMEFFVA